MSARRNAAGFTLRELICVLVVIGLGLAVLLPTLNSPRGGPSRRSICMNNMRNLALSAKNYDSIHGRYPGYRDVVTNSVGRRFARPMLYMLMPQLERMDIYEVFGPERHPQDGVPDLFLQLSVCPTAEYEAGAASKEPICNYICNAGMPDWPSAEAPPDWPAKGVFQDRYQCEVHGHKLPHNNGGYIGQHDGLTNTLIFSERLALGHWNDMAEHEVGFVWHPRLEPGAPSEPSPGAPDVDMAKYQPARPSSGHPGVVNVAFCDGHVRCVDATIDYRVYAQLMTPCGDNAAYPGLLSGNRLEVDDAFRRCQLPTEFQ